MAASYDLIVIGAGPGGYVAAIRAGQLGLNVLLIEKDERFGGCCLNRGCIPTKALLESTKLYWKAKDKAAIHGINIGQISFDFGQMMQRKDQILLQNHKGIEALLKKHSITILHGTAQLLGQGKVGVGQEIYAAEKILLATGSAPWAPANLPVDGKKVLTSDEILSLPALPQSLIIIGAGVIGLEMATIFHRLGVAVEVIELKDQILPGMDGDLVKELHRALKKQKIKIHLSHQIQSLDTQGPGVALKAKDAKGKELNLNAEIALVAVGRRAITQGLGLENTQAQLTPQGLIQVDENLQTAEPGLFAIGDLVPGPMLAHKASEEGVKAVEFMTGYHENSEPLIIPSAIYTSPEAASVGVTEEALQQEGRAFRSGVFAFRSLGRTQTTGELDGIAKVLIDEESEKVLGVHLVGENASDLIQIGVLALQQGLTASQLGEAVYAHPTFSEAIKEAALAALGRAIHG